MTLQKPFSGVWTRALQSAKKVVLMTMLCVLCFFASDTVARIYFWFHDLQPDYRTKSDAYTGQSWVEQYFREDAQAQIQWNSYDYWQHQPFSGAYVNVDISGQRRTVNSESDSPKWQLYLFGGSTMWGTGARDDHTIPSLVAQELTGEGCSHVEVMNFGEVGYVSTQELISLMLRLRTGVRPTAVVFYDGINDTLSAYQLGSAGLPLNEDNRRIEFNMSTGANSSYALVRQLGLYRVAEIISGRVAAVAAPRIPPSDVAQAVLTNYIGNLQMIDSLSAGYGFKSYYFWQPVIYSKSSLSVWENSERAKMPNGMSNFFSDVYGLVQGSERLRQFDSFHNISGVFRSEPSTVFVDSWHTSEQGNAMIARAITDAILPTVGCPR